MGTRGPVMGTYPEVLGQQREDSPICEDKLAALKGTGIRGTLIFPLLLPSPLGLWRP